MCNGCSGSLAFWLSSDACSARCSLSGKVSVSL